MRLARSIAVVYAALLAGAARGEAPQPPAFRLGDAATPVAYEARLAIDPKDSRFSGEIRIDLRFNRAVPVLWLNASRLDFEAAEFRQGERRIAVRVLPGGEDFVGFEAEGEPFAPGAASAVLRYRGPIEPLATEGVFRQQEGGDWYVVSQFETLHARRAFPCFDEPRWKTPWRLTIDAPDANVVVSNTPESEAREVPGRAGWRRHHFAATPPLPSYLIALAVGPFDVVDGGKAGVRATPLRYLAPKGRGVELRWAKESTPRLLELHEDYFGTPYPYEKLDAVVIAQTVTFGAMENVGMITYASNLLLAKPREETIAFKRSYAAVAAHEIAHMWFGNLVTLAWWDDVWLNEAFAQWAGQKALYRFNPEWDTGAYRASARAEAIGTDRLTSARRIHNPVLEKDEVDAAFDGITYQKGGEVLQMFEAWLTPERFRAGVRAYLARHAWGTATSQDFFRALGEASGQADAVLAAFSAFVEQPGVPLIDVALHCGRKAALVETRQHRMRPAGSRAAEMRWTTPVCLRYSVNGKLHTHCAGIENDVHSLELPATRNACPDWILGNAAGIGHYVVRYEPSLAKRIEARMSALPVHEAVAFTSDTGLLAQSGLLSIEAALERADRALGHPSPVVKLKAVLLLHDLSDAWLTTSQAARKRAIVARRIQPLAAKLGWRPKAGEKEEVELLRIALLPFAAETETRDVLRLEARGMALAWVGDRAAVPETMVRPVLDTAARFADRATYARLEAATLATKDRRERSNLLAALAKVRDERLRERAFALALEMDNSVERLNGRDAHLLLARALDDEANRKAAFAFVRAHFDALVTKLPEHTPGDFPRPLGQLCTSADRDLFVGFFRSRVGRFLGGQRHYDEALEAIEICVAARALTS